LIFLIHLLFKQRRVLSSALVSSISRSSFTHQLAGFKT